SRRRRRHDLRTERQGLLELEFDRPHGEIRQAARPLELAPELLHLLVNPEDVPEAADRARPLLLEDRDTLLEIEGILSRHVLEFDLLREHALHRDLYVGHRGCEASAHGAKRIPALLYLLLPREQLLHLLEVIGFVLHRISEQVESKRRASLEEVDALWSDGALEPVRERGDDLVVVLHGVVVIRDRV